MLRIPFALPGVLIASALFTNAVHGQTVSLQETTQKRAAVTVLPDNALAAEQRAGTAGRAVEFTVTNAGTEPDTYELGCIGLAKVSCFRMSPRLVTVAPGDSVTIKVKFTVRDGGTGLLTLFAYSRSTRAGDSGSYRVPVAP